MTVDSAEKAASAQRRVPDAAERASLLRALTVWTGDATAAEDLTQQTLLAAWSSERQPQAESAWTPWLFGIARHRLLRWRREQVRNGRRLAPESERHLMAAASHEVVDALVEREDIVAILDGALSRIPAESRRALLLRYVEELPQREVAAKLGIGEGALEGRLHRGKRAMGRILLTGRDTWFDTDTWCFDCGRQRLLARWTEGGDLRVDCPACEAAPMHGARSTMIRTDDAEQGIQSRFGDPATTSVRTAITRTLASVYEATTDGFSTARVCPRCGGSVHMTIGPFDVHPPELYMRCVRCRFVYWRGWSASSCGSHPLVTDWLSRQKRTRMTTREFVTTIDNRPATLTRFESLTSSSTITAWRDLGTMRFVLVERDGVAINPATTS